MPKVVQDKGRHGRMFYCEGPHTEYGISKAFHSCEYEKIGKPETRDRNAEIRSKCDQIIKPGIPSGGRKNPEGNGNGKNN